MMEQKYQTFLKTEFTVFDIETSGLNPVKDEILEIAALKLKGPKTAEKFQSLIQPSRPIPDEVEKIHGLNEIFLLVNGEKPEQTLKKFFNFIKGTILVGHNIKEFDWLFIINQAKKKSLTPPEVKFIDTLELAKKILPIPGFNLSKVAEHFGLKHQNAHRAMPDVEINTLVFLKIMEKILQEKLT